MCLSTNGSEWIKVEWVHKHNRMFKEFWRWRHDRTCRWHIFEWRAEIYPELTLDPHPLEIARGEEGEKVEGKEAKEEAQVRKKCAPCLESRYAQAWRAGPGRDFYLNVEKKKLLRSVASVSRSLRLCSGASKRRPFNSPSRHRLLPSGEPIN